jgi:lysophospholipid acyltransferase (LPLAT)-like uncharacterized protein
MPQFVRRQSIIAALPEPRKALTELVKSSLSRAMPSLLKRVTQSGAATHAASALITRYIRFVGATTKFEMFGREAVEALIAENKGVICAYWHQRMMLGPILRRQTDRRVFQLASHHRDAAIMADAAAPLGIEFIRGSSADPKKKFKDKGGPGAVAQMIAVLKEGQLVAVTPDGPRGPARKASAGVVRLAQLSGAPILPGAYAASRVLTLDTWDKFLVTAPFGRAVFMAGPPIRVAQDAGPDEIETARASLEFELNAVTDAADRAVGRSPELAALG